MGRTQRNRLTIHRPGTPGLYQHAPLPEAWEIVGVVTIGAGESGALVRNKHTGVYCMANAGVIRSLPQRKVIAALAGGV